jgi:hypothetical protein
VKIRSTTFFSPNVSENFSQGCLWNAFYCLTYSYESLFQRFSNFSAARIQLELSGGSRYYSSYFMQRGIQFRELGIHRTVVRAGGMKVWEVSLHCFKSSHCSRNQHSLKLLPYCFHHKS